MTSRDGSGRTVRPPGADPSRSRRNRVMGSAYRLLSLSFLGACGLAIASCSNGGGAKGSDAGVCLMGYETCACYPNSTCQGGLTCASNVCVNLGAGVGGGSGTG